MAKKTYAARRFDDATGKPTDDVQTFPTREALDAFLAAAPPWREE